MRTAILSCLLLCSSLSAADKIKVLLIDGQNNHKWDITSPIMKSMLEATGHFAVTVSTSPPEKKKAKPEEVATLPERWQAWRPDFVAHEVVISNYNGELWPEEVRTAFEQYVAGGGGFVAIHAADNSFPEWPEYNKATPGNGFREGGLLHAKLILKLQE